MRTAIYTRISQDRTGAGLGVERQEQDCRELADKLELDDITVYSDNDFSAYNGKPRPSYEQLISDLRAGEIGAVICWHTDRLHRSPRELETYIDVAEKVPTYTVKAGVLDLTSASGRMVARVTGAVARHESEHKSERQRRKSDELAAKGLPMGGARPFGYEAGGMVIDAVEAEELQLMVEKVLKGDSLRSIIRDLNDRGMTTTRGGKWNYTSLRTLLLRPRNAGLMQHRGEVVGDAAWPAIVSRTNHDAVAAVLKDPGRRTSPGPARVHLLSGLAKCGVCGRGLKPQWISFRGNGRRHYVYRCPEGKGHVSRSMSKVDAYVVERVVRTLGFFSIPPRPGADVSALEVERGELHVMLDEAAQMFARREINAAQLARISADSEVRLKEIGDELSERVRGTDLDGYTDITQETWDGLDLERKRRIIDALLTVHVHRVQHLGPAQELHVEVRVRTSTGRFGMTKPADLTREIINAART